jgi:hypothetical protein
MICPVGTESDINSIFDALEEFTDLAQWHFLFATPQEINSYYAQLKLVGKLDSNSGTPDVYILDKEKPQREKEGKRFKEGYSTFSPAELSNEMLDDFKVILYEYL